MDRRRYELRDLVAAAAGPRQVGDTRDSWLRRGARNAGLSYRQVKAAFYGEIKFNAKAATKLKQAAGRQEAENLAGQFERAAECLRHRSADRYSADIDALVRAARYLRMLGNA